jgi:hypothetical protein
VVHTDREVTTNKPNIVSNNKKEETCVLINVAIPADRNFVQQEAEKNIKYKSLCIETQQMWNRKCMIILVKIGVTGLVIKGLEENLEAIPGEHSIDSLQKTSVHGTAHIIQKVVQSETGGLGGGDHCWFKRSTMEKWHVTRVSNDNVTMMMMIIIIII